MAKPRVLYWDIETSLELVSVFDLKYNDFIDPSNIYQERHLISAAWQWEGEEKVHSVSLLDFPSMFKKDPHNDKGVCEKLHEVLSSADCLVAHNGDSFDTKYVETRMLFHGLSPLPVIPSIDTYKIAKNRFKFNSNKLDYLGHYLGLGRKIQTTKGLWLGALKGDPKAIKEMVTYNKQDVVLLKKVFQKLQPFCQNHINRQLFGQTEGCPRCGSKKVQS
jgi:uncharacterized protein YprB with RNaseH-like and TPR domain